MTDCSIASYTSNVLGPCNWQNLTLQLGRRQRCDGMYRCELSSTTRCVVLARVQLHSFHGVQASIWREVCLDCLLELQATQAACLSLLLKASNRSEIRKA